MSETDQDAAIARAFLDGASFEELRERFPERDVEQAVRNHHRRHDLEALREQVAGLTRCMGHMLDALGLATPVAPNTSLRFGPLYERARAAFQAIEDAL